MIRQMSLVVAAAAVVAAAPAAAQEESPQGRYQMQPVEDGLARLDTRTGEIAFCRAEGATISCDGSRGAVGGDAGSRLDALERRVEALEKRGRALVDRQDADYAVEQMKKLFRGFADIVRDLEQDVTRPQPEDATPPDRT